MIHTLVALVQDHPGVLTRVVSLVRRRGYNIHSLAVGPSEAQGVSRITLVVESDDVEQIVKQLYRLIEVVKVVDVTGSLVVERELALLKVNARSGDSAELFAIVKACGGTIANVATSSVIVEMNAAPDKVDNLVEVLQPFGIQELARTGRVAMLPDSRTQTSSRNGGKSRTGSQSVAEKEPMTAED
jgi:acetolactate synthase-1/3 small subunit